MGGIEVLDREVYYTSEAGRLLGVATATLNRWLDGHARTGKFYEPILRDEPRPRPVTGPRVVTWGEFIEAGHLAAYRSQGNVPLQRLRRYVDDWRGARGIPYPLAHKKPLVDPYRDLLDREGDQVLRHKDRQVQIPAAEEAVDAFFARIDFDDGTAARYWPDGRDIPVVLDPSRQFGSPTVADRSVRTATLYGMHAGGDSAESLADIYELDVGHVQEAIRFERRLAERAISAYAAA